MSGSLVDRITAELAYHVGGWIDNGKRDKCHCACGYRPSLGEFHGKHVAERVAELFTMQRRQFDSYGHENPEVRWVSGWTAVEEKP